MLPFILSHEYIKLKTISLSSLVFRERGKAHLKIVYYFTFLFRFSLNFFFSKTAIRATMQLPLPHSS
jgi:hypothetical protein